MKLELNKRLLRGSFALVIAFGLYNLFNFLFHFSMARILSISDYGILAALFSVIYLSSLFAEAVQTVIAKYSSRSNTEGMLKNILKRASKKAVLISSICFCIYLIVSIPLSKLLEINYSLLAFNGLVLFISFVLPVYRGLLQGMKKFKNLGLNMIIESSAKLVLSIFFVMLGWRVYGALAGVLAGGAIAILLSFVPLRKVLKSKETKIELNDIYDYAKPAFFVSALIILFYSVDLIIAKMIFPVEVAGAYAIASVLSKIIFWGTLPISKAMFPMTAENGADKRSLLTSALAILLIGIAIVLCAFYFFNEPIVELFSGKSLPESSQILFFLGIAMSFISLTNLILLYKLSLGKTKGFYKLAIFLVIEVISLFVFHDNLLTFSYALTISSAVFFVGVLFFAMKKNVSLHHINLKEQENKQTYA